MHDLLVAVGGMAYGSVAFRAAYVIVRARKRHGVSEDKFIAGIYGLFWPATLVITGLAIGLTGDPGVFSSPLASHSRQDEP